jgi:histone chaperone ASF1
VTYVGCANDPTQDQVLEEVLVGPVSVGVNNFVLTAPAPDFSVIPVPDLIGVTVLLITCSYLEQEFVKIGYYVNNEYNDPSLPSPLPALSSSSSAEELQIPVVAPPPLPAQVEIQNMYRNILADKPIVTRINIDWSGNGSGGNDSGDMPQEGEEEVEVFTTSEGTAVANQTILLEEDSMDVERMQLNMRRIS